MELSKSYLVMLQFSFCAYVILLDLNFLYTIDTNSPPKIYQKTKENGKNLEDFCLFQNGTKSYWIISYNTAWQKVFEEHVFLLLLLLLKKMGPPCDIL